MALRRKFAWAWILWLVGFGVIEYIAIKNDGVGEGNFTLSHYARRLAASSWIFRVALTLLLAWLPGHFELASSFVWRVIGQAINMF